MGNEVEFRGLFRTSPKMNVVPGEWYLGFICLNCDSRFAVLEDPSGEGGTQPLGRGGFEVACPACGKTSTYTAERMIGFQAASALPATPPP